MQYVIIRLQCRKTITPIKTLCRNSWVMTEMSLKELSWCVMLRPKRHKTTHIWLKVLFTCTNAECDCNFKNYSARREKNVGKGDTQTVTRHACTTDAKLPNRVQKDIKLAEDIRCEVNYRLTSKITLNKRSFTPVAKHSAVTINHLIIRHKATKLSWVCHDDKLSVHITYDRQIELCCWSTLILLDGRPETTGKAEMLLTANPVHHWGPNYQ